ncbi:MAG: hypothetical protein M3N50_15315 [Pseudomonadota bacterium]|nr:hypothetical protein [Pseudomonadota bacterium]
MKRNNPKPSAKSRHNDDAVVPATGLEPGADASGRVTFDDRGNAIWEWSSAPGAFGREVSAERLRRLEHPALSIATDAPTPCDTVRPNPLGTKKGYDPYDSGKLGKRPVSAKKKDLRKLSEWLKLKKQADSNNPGEE